MVALLPVDPVQIFLRVHSVFLGPLAPSPSRVQCGFELIDPKLLTLSYVFPGFARAVFQPRDRKVAPAFGPDAVVQLTFLKLDASVVPVAKQPAVEGLCG